MSKTVEEVIAIKTSKKHVAFVIFTVLLCIFAKYAAMILLPLGTAPAIAYICLKFAGKLKLKSRRGEKVIAAVISVLIYAVFLFSITIIIRKIYLSSADLCRAVISDTDKISALLDGARGKIMSRISDGKFADMFFFGIKVVFEGLLSALPPFFARIASDVPKILLAIIVTVAATVYFCLDGDAVFRFIKKHTKKSTGMVFGAIGAYALIFLLTFAELFLGFSLIGVRFSFFAAALTALVDILPVLGTGTVLIPWAVGKFIMGEKSFAVSLLILWAVITVVRQIAEPKLVGDGVGIPPLLSLAAAYVGFCLFGAGGGIILPLAAAVAFAFYKSEKTNEASA